MKKIHQLQARVRELTTNQQQGSFLLDILKDKVDSDTLSRAMIAYQETLRDLNDAQAQLEAEIDAEKQRMRNAALSAYADKGVVKYAEDGMQASVRLSVSYGAHEALAILQENNLYEKAIEEGVLRTSVEVDKKLVKGVYADLLADAKIERVSSVVVKVVEDE